MYLALKRNYVPCRSKRKEDIKDHNDQKDQRAKKIAVHLMSEQK